MSQRPDRDAPQAVVARSAFEKVEQVTSHHQPYQARYASLARRLPAMLQQNGLGQTLAFLYAKGNGLRFEKADGLMLRHLSELSDLIKDGDPAPPDPMRLVVQMTQDRYRAASRKAAVAAVWLKRFSEGLIGAIDDPVDG